MVFKKKRNILFVLLKQINDELNRLGKMGVLSKVDDSDWASPTVYIKKKSKDICVCAYFFIGLNDAFRSYHYPLLGPKEVFVPLSWGRTF